MKKYEEPRMKLHELKSGAAILQASGQSTEFHTIVKETKAYPMEDDFGDPIPATQGFSSREAW